MLIYINFSFDFLSLDNIDFENYFPNESFFTEPFKTLAVRALSRLPLRVLVSDIALLLVNYML